MSKFTEPEIYRVQRTKHCPNNILPILVYRKVLPEPYDEVTASEFLQANEWVKQVSSRITARLLRFFFFIQPVVLFTVT